MTSAVLVEIADCVLNDFLAAHAAGKLSQPIVGKRGYVPEFTPGKQSHGVYQVYVAHDKEETTRLDRTSISVEYTIEIGVCCRLPSVDPDTVDPAMYLIQQMADFFFDYGLSQPLALWEKNEVYFWGDKERIKYDGAFFALWDATFRGARNRL
jgi:hypothetical protein